MRIFVLLPLLIVLGSCSKPSLEDSIVGKVITLEMKEKEMQVQMMFNANGVMLVGADGNLQDLGLTYQLKGNEVLVFEDGERNGGMLFPSSSPKAGDQVEMGPEDEKQKVTIIKIEQGNAEATEPTERLPLHAMPEAVRTTQAGKDVQDLKQAISSYQLEYARLPYDGQQDVELNTEDDDIISILAGVEGHPLNIRGHSFYEGKRAKDARGGEPVGGIHGEGDNLKMADPWGQPYYMIIDANYDNEVKNPVSGGVLRQTIIVWSKGKPRKEGVPNDPKDWHTSW
jgi:hypothetical protein